MPFQFAEPGNVFTITTQFSNPFSFFFLKTAKCGNLLNDSLIHLSSTTIRGSSFNESWQVPLLDGNYSWCPTDSDLTRKLEIDLGKGRAQKRAFW